MGAKPVAAIDAAIGRLEPYVSKGRKPDWPLLHMLDQRSLARSLLPVGTLTKAAVRDRATALGLRTATKPDSQDVCFITATGGGRRTFLGDRIALHPGRLVDRSGAAGQPGRRGRAGSPSASARAWPAPVSPATRSTSTCPAAP
jgi:hypothetical protein